ncbi:hypothetical protein L0Y49_02785, partial [bacterium]|nr:hypothetical protein [bacterium]
ERERLEKEKTALSSSVGALESEYLSLRNGISFEYAEMVGFKQADEPIFVSRKAFAQNGF